MSEEVKSASEQKKELLGLEKVEEQIAVFDAIPDSLEIRSIMNMVNDFDGQRKELVELLKRLDQGLRR